VRYRRKKFTFAISSPDEFLYSEEKLNSVFVFIIFAILLGKIDKVANVAYNSTFAYSAYGILTGTCLHINRYCSMVDFPFFKMAAVRYLGFLNVVNFNFRSGLEAQYASAYQISWRSV